MLAHDRLQAPYIVRQPLGTHGGVFDADNRLARTAHTHQQRHACFTHGPHHLLLARIEKGLLPNANAALGQRGELVVDIVPKLDDESSLRRLRVEFQQRTNRRERKLPARLIEQHTIDMFDGRRFKIEKIDRRLHRVDHRCKKKHGQPLSLRDGNEFKFRRRDGDKGALAAAEKRRQIAWPTKPFAKAITRPPLAQTIRKTLADRSLMTTNLLRNSPIETGKRRRVATHRLDAAIRKNRLNGTDMIARQSILRRARPRRIVRDHPAKSRA